MQDGEWDLVLCDCQLPGFGPLSALEMLRQQKLDLPFILVSGQLNDEQAVDLMRAGAHDFVRKDNTARLLPAIHRELGEAELRRFQLRSSERLRQAAKVFESTREGVLVTDHKSRIQRVNPAFERITGYTEQEVLGQNPRLFKSGRHGAEFYAEMWSSLEQQGSWQGEIWNRRKNGEIYPEWLSISQVLDEKGSLTHYVGVFSDLSRIKRSEEKLSYLAHHDPLTGLPNRLLFQARLSHAMERARRDGNQLALLNLDIDRFKNVNDSLGHPVGDRLLHQVGQRLKSLVREYDSVCRPGGDEFLILVELKGEPQEAALIAQKILAGLSKPFLLGLDEMHISVSMGISLFPGDADDEPALLRNADTAMFRAKETGAGGYQFYTPEMTELAFERLMLESQLRKAVKGQQLRLHYQPQVSLESGELVGAEGLVRWQHPDLGLVSPARFIPLAEETGLIRQVGRWVLEEGCRQLRQWLDQGLWQGTLSLNLSGQQLAQDDLVEQVARILDLHGIPAHFLKLEVTEGFVMAQAEGAIERLHELRRLGVSIAIDDFGTGYSSLSYLKRLPVDELKIDQSFIRELDLDVKDAAIVRSILSLGQNLGLQVMAEGVEREEQQQLLRQFGCPGVQGFLFGRPLPSEEFGALLRQGPHFLI